MVVVYYGSHELSTFVKKVILVLLCWYYSFVIISWYKKG